MQFAPASSEVVDEFESARHAGPWRRALTRFRRRPLGVVALIIFLAYCVVAVLAKKIAPYDIGVADMQLFQHPKSPLYRGHVFGTDVFGHDVLSQVLVGIRYTMESAVACAAICTAFGVVVGALAGFYGGWLDAFVTWVTGVVVAVPAIVVLMVVLVWSKYPVTPLGNGLYLTFVLWAPVARVVRATVRSLRHTEYAEAARASGASGLRILVRHLLPNASGQMIVAATSIVGQEIVILATVNYLGYSVEQTEAPTLGGLIAQGTRSPSLMLSSGWTASDLWWLYLIPVLVLVFLLLSVVFLGDALDDALTPTTQ
jgi:peptide/nickel transport system permease protein